MTINQWIGIGLSAVGLLFITIGLFGVYTYKNFYAKATIASLIDSVGFLLIATGIMAYMGISTFSLKVLFLILLTLLLNPLGNHYIVRGAHTSGYRPGKER